MQEFSAVFSRETFNLIFLFDLTLDWSLGGISVYIMKLFSQGKQQNQLFVYMPEIDVYI